MNKYLKVSLTLATIASGSALLIGLMNLATVNAIKVNKEKKITTGLSKLYPDMTGYSGSEFHMPDDEYFKPGYDSSKYPHLKYVYTVHLLDNGRPTKSYVYNTTGKNAYGQVDLLVAVENGKVEKMFVVTNTESYGPTLEDNYINKYNNGYLTDLADVKCGATYGAKTVKEQCDEAVAHWTEFYKEAE